MEGLGITLQQATELAWRETRESMVERSSGLDRRATPALPYSAALQY
jgi:hypothetical protein